jgi:hypothetical protein
VLLLTSTSDLVRVHSDASVDIEVHASWVDNASGTITPGRTNTASITGTVQTTVVASPASSTQRNVKFLSIRNNHGSTSAVVDVDHTDGTNVEILHKVTLLAGELLVLDSVGVWSHYDANGGLYPVSLPVATQADMEAGTSIVLSVTPGRLHFHPAAAKFWCKCGTAGATDAAYNVSSLTDGGVGLMTVNIGNDFSSANYAYSVSIENLDATIDAAADGMICMLGTAGQAAGSLAFINKAEAGTAAADPTKWAVIGFGDL